MSEGLSRHIGVLYRPTGKIKCENGGIKSWQGRGDLKWGLAAHRKATDSEGDTGSPALKKVSIEPSCEVRQLQRFASPEGLEPVLPWDGAKVKVSRASAGSCEDQGRAVE